MENVFNWENIYSKNNAKVVEKLLDRKAVPFIEIIKIFFPNRAPDSDTYLMSLISYDFIRHFLKNHIIELCKEENFPLCFFSLEYFYLCYRWGLKHEKNYIFHIGETGLKVYVDKILSLLIKFGDLPIEICRLPRLANDDILPNYYEDILDYNSATDEEIIFHDNNYCSSEPITLTYIEAIKLLEQKGYPRSLITIYVKQGKIGLFLQVAHESITNYSQMRQYSKQSIEYFRAANCGNPFYIKRYPGLERLTQDTIDRLLDGKSISIKNKMSLNLKVQSTDIETKYHYERYINSCVQIEENGTKKTSNVFQLKDTLLLQEDLEALIRFEEAAQLTTDDDIYNSINFSLEEYKRLSKQIPNETTESRKQRTYDQTNYYEAELKKRHPGREISRPRIARTLHRLEQPIYQSLKIPQKANADTYERNERERRNAPKSKKNKSP